MEYVSPDFFEVLQVGAAIGRTFLSGEGRQAAEAPVVVLSHRAWQNRLGGDSSVVGRIVHLGTTAHAVIGVMPESFTFTDSLVAPEMYAPVAQFGLLGAARGDLRTDRSREVFALIGRLKGGVTVADARANLAVLTAALATEYPDDMEHSELWVEPERRARPFPEFARIMTPMLTFLMAVGALVLLIACANVATLLVGRGMSRQREMALRAGLGATRLRLVRQLISESLLLALLGGTGGLLAARWSIDLLISIEIGPLRAEGAFDVRMDWRVFAFTAVVATLTGVIAGLAPALRTTRVDLTCAIGNAGRGSSHGAAGQRLTSGLVVAQVALSLLLLVCAGLFVKSGQNAATLDVGFRTDHLLLVSMDPVSQGYAPERVGGLYRDLADEVATLPGVRSVSWAREAPQLRPNAIQIVTLDGGTIPEADPIRIYRNGVDPAYFDTLDVPVIQGRAFRAEDATDGRDVALVSETAAQRFWPGQDPLGKRFLASLRRPGPFDATPPNRQFQVVGVVRDARFSLDITVPHPFVLLPFGQAPAEPATLHVHTDGPPTAVGSAVTEAIHSHDPTLAIYGVTSMDRHVHDGPMLSYSRLAATMIGAFGALGLLLAAVGLYGVVAYSVTQRMQEFSIRTALGATAAGIMRLALGRGAVLIGIGLALGFLAASAVTRVIAGALVDVHPTDPVVFAVMGLVLTGVALVACLIPSGRAATADPVAALNAD